MVGTIVHQLTRNLTEEQIKEAGFEPYFVDHTTGVFPQFASGYPWSASTMQVTGDTIADLTEDLAAEQKARVTYDNILRLSDDPDVSDVIKFLRAREIVHFQRFGEAKRTRWKCKMELLTIKPPELLSIGSSGGCFLSYSSTTYISQRPSVQQKKCLLSLHQPIRSYCAGSTILPSGVISPSLYLPLEPPVTDVLPSALVKPS